MFMREVNNESAHIKAADDLAAPTSPRSSFSGAEATGDGSPNVSQLLFQVSLGLYGLSLCVPAVRACGVEGLGYKCLVAAVVWCPPAWFANFVFFLGVALLVCREPAGAYICGLVAFALGLMVFAPVPGGLAYTGVERLEGLRVGYFFWQASFAALTVASIITSRTGKTASHETISPKDRTP
jgi:hypothetical protein